MTKEALWTKPFLLTGGVNFFQLFTQYILITTLPLCIIDEFHGSELEAGLAMTFFQIGTTFITYRKISKITKGQGGMGGPGAIIISW